MAIFIMGKKSIKKNYIYNLIQQIVSIIIPVVTTPYISRVLTDYGVGQYSFSNSLALYFTLFANLGFNIYASREIAKVQDDKEAQSKIFTEITILKFISTFISLAVYFSIIQFPFFESYRLYLYFLSSLIIAVGIDTTFVFQGNEDFKQIAIRNIINFTNFYIYFCKKRY